MNKTNIKGFTKGNKLSYPKIIKYLKLYRSVLKRQYKHMNEIRMYYL